MQQQKYKRLLQLKIAEIKQRDILEHEQWRLELHQEMCTNTRQQMLADGASQADIEDVIATLEEVYQIQKNQSDHQPVTLPDGQVIDHDKLVLMRAMQELQEEGITPKKPSMMMVYAIVLLVLGFFIFTIFL